MPVTQEKGALGLIYAATMDWEIGQFNIDFDSSL